MKVIVHFFIYLILFVIGFTLLKYANILELNAVSGGEYFSKFSIMVIVLAAIARWGITLFTRLITNKKS